MNNPVMKGFVSHQQASLHRSEVQPGASLGPSESVPKPKLLDRVRLAIRTRHYSQRTEQAYVNWVKRFVLFHGKRHPAEMGEPEINAFLTHLAVKEKVGASRRRIRPFRRFSFSIAMSSGAKSAI